MRKHLFGVLLAIGFVVVAVRSQVNWPQPLVGGGSSGTVLTMVPWANTPTGAMDFSIKGQTYSIAAASAITNFLSTQTVSSKNFIDFDVTNATGGDLVLYITASGYLANDGSRSFTITNKSQREIRFSTSAMGVRGVSQPWF